MFASLARAPAARPTWGSTASPSERQAGHTPRAPWCPRSRPSGPPARDRGAPAAAAPEPSGRRDGDASTSSSPSVPVVTRAPPTAGTAEVVIRYAYPGVRFSQAKVVIARVPAGATSAARRRSSEHSESSSDSAFVAVDGARVLAALAEDGVDVRRWRARVALDHERAECGMVRSPESETASGGDAAESAEAFAARASRGKTFQSHVGWRALAEDDRIDFHEDAVGLLVQLEDALVAKLGTADEAAYGARRDGGRDGGEGVDAFAAKLKKKRGGGRRGAKARARRARDPQSAAEPGIEPGTLESPSMKPFDARRSQEPREFSRATSFWKSPDEQTEPRGDDGFVPGNNPYADARSFGTTIWPRDPNATDAGYFGIGVVRPKHEANVGTLWRSAWQMGAGFMFTVGARFKYEASDTTQAHKQIPLFKHGDWSSFAEASPHGAVWVAVEMGSGSVPLQDFAHPPRAVYVLGSEDNGLNRPIVEACQCHVALPKWVGRSSSYNVAVAGSLVMYDRLIKRLALGAYEARE